MKIRTTLCVLAVPVLAAVLVSCSAGVSKAKSGTSDNVAPSVLPAAGVAALHEAGFDTFSTRIDAPDFTLESTTGKKIQLSHLRGKVVLVNFWATWCPPCRAEMPSMQEMYQQLKPLGIEVVAVDVQEDRPAISSFQTQEGQQFTFPIAIDTTGAVAAHYGVRGIPSTFVIGSDGVAIGRVVGGKDWTARSVLEALKATLHSVGS